MRRVGLGGLRGGQALFRAEAATWLDHHLGADSSIATYRLVLRAHIDPAIGGKPIGVIRRGDIKALIAGMHRKGLSASRIGWPTWSSAPSSPRPSATRSSRPAGRAPWSPPPSPAAVRGVPPPPSPGSRRAMRARSTTSSACRPGTARSLGSTIRTGRIRTRSSPPRAQPGGAMEERCPVRQARTVSVASEASKITLSRQDLREVTRYAAESAQCVLEIFETAHPADSRPRDAIDAAWTFARCGERGKALRDAAWAALKAARDAGTTGAGEAARAAMFAASAAYLHPLASAYQVKHILGAAAHAARAAELMAGDDQDVGAGQY